MSVELCPICHWRHVRRNGRCDTCAAYLRRHGTDRPEHLIIRHGRRILEQQATR